MVIYHEVVLNVDLLVLRQFFQFHPIQQGFIDAIGNAASERGCVVVLLDFPDGHGIHTAWEGAIYAAGKSAHGSAVTGGRSELTRVIVTLVTLGSGFHQHVDDAGQVSVSPLLASL